MVGLETGDPRPPLLPATEAERRDSQNFENADLLARVGLAVSGASGW